MYALNAQRTSILTIKVSVVKLSLSADSLIDRKEFVLRVIKAII